MSDNQIGQIVETALWPWLRAGVAYRYTEVETADVDQRGHERGRTGCEVELESAQAKREHGAHEGCLRRRRQQDSSPPPSQCGRSARSKGWRGLARGRSEGNQSRRAQSRARYPQISHLSPQDVDDLVVYILSLYAARHLFAGGVTGGMFS